MQQPDFARIIGPEATRLLLHVKAHGAEDLTSSDALTITEAYYRCRNEASTPAFLRAICEALSYYLAISSTQEDA